MPVPDSPSPDRPSQPAHRRRALPRRWAAALAASAVLLVLAALVMQVWGSRRPATGDAEWIWAELPERLPAPAAFYLVRDFQVPAELAEPGPPPGDAAGAPPAPRLPAPRLMIQGDEEYVLHLNGRRLGSNRYRPGAPLDVYRLDGLLLPGTNRLAVELRSSRGAGGFLAALGPVGGDPWLVSDRSWRVVRHYAPGLVEGWLPLPELASAPGSDGGAEDPASAGGTAEPAPDAPLTAERPISWGRPPVGRWHRPEAGEPRPTLAAVGDPCPAGPALGQAGGGGGAGDPEAVRALFDFGRQVTGYLVVEHPPTAPSAPAQVSLFALGDQPLTLLPSASGETSGEPAPGEAPAAEVAEGDALPLVTLPGRALWTDVVPRTFRYAAVAGLRAPVSVAVLEIEPEALAELPGAVRGEAAEGGLSWLPPRPHRTPTEDMVRRRLADAAEKVEGAAAADSEEETGAER